MQVGVERLEQALEDYVSGGVTTAHATFDAEIADLHPRVTELISLAKRDPSLPLPILKEFSNELNAYEPIAARIFAMPDPNRSRAERWLASESAQLSAAIERVQL